VALLAIQSQTLDITAVTLRLADTSHHLDMQCPDMRCPDMQRLDMQRLGMQRLDMPGLWHSPDTSELKSRLQHQELLG
jgi:hypothetical protein